MDHSSQATTPLILKREEAQDLFDEILPLLIEHKQEIAHYQDIRLNVDVEFYERAEANGALRCYTARAGTALIGYAVFFVRHNTHYQDSLQANQDVLFVTKPYRKGRVGLRLIRFAEDELRKEGVQVVYQHLKVNRPDTIDLFHKLGYEDVDLIVAKRLDR